MISAGLAPDVSRAILAPPLSTNFNILVSDVSLLLSELASVAAAVIVFIFATSNISDVFSKSVNVSSSILSEDNLLLPSIRNIPLPAL